MQLNFTRRQWMTLLIIGLADFCNAICVSLQAPFFPKEAELKGATATEYGLVFGVFELVVFIVSPIYGQYLSKIGPKLLFNSGILTTGTSAILFGLLDHVHDHTMFITLAFIIRVVEAMGNAAFLTASFAIIAKEFPNNVATTFASLETFFGLGLIVGPMIGGALYSIGGYYLPFVVLGSALFTTAILTIFILPKHANDRDLDGRPPSMKTILKIPGVIVCSLEICATSASIGFIGATLEPHLRQFNLKPILLGMVFVINGGIYALTAPFWGWIVDKILNPKIASLIGSVMIAAGFCIIGPVSFVPLEPQLNYAIYGLILHGFGIAALLVSSFSDALRTTISSGLADNIETYGLISGLWTSTFALGAFIGPSVSGILYDSIGFRKSCIFIISLLVFVAIVIIFYLLVENRPSTQYKELSSTESLVKGRERLISINVENSFKFPKSGSLITLNGTPISIDPPQSHACGMNSLLMSASSYGIKQNQWSSRLESEQPTLGFSQYYGSIERHAGHSEIS